MNDEIDNAEWLVMAKDCYAASTSYVEQNYRQRWEDSLNFFHSKHAKSSKYNTEAYRYRSKIFRPKSRSVVRKHESTAALAFFSNIDVVSVSPVDGDDPNQVASALINKELLNYRLTKTIPWFTTLLGAFQDTMKSGVCVSFQYWKFKGHPNVQEIEPFSPEEQKDEWAESSQPEIGEPSGNYQIERDEPCVELHPVENLRFSPAANWQDPINTSPYVILVIPMYVYQVQAMSSEDDAAGSDMPWNQASIGQLRNSRMDSMDSMERARRNDASSPNIDNGSVDQYDVVEVRLNFMATANGHAVFYTLKDTFLLTDPVDLKDFVWHGKMPIVVGYSILDTHNPMPEGLIDIGKQLQTEANEISNQRLDNVKLVLNKRWIVRRNANIDTDSLLRNVPGGVTMASNIESDIREVNWQDVTSSSFQEQDRINVDYDELLGNFASSSVMTNRKLNETVGGMKIMAQGANGLTEYTIRTFVETWVEPVLRQLMSLEQCYESDETILALAGKKVKLYQRFGMNAITDHLLEQDLTLTVNVGMGATDPDQRLQRFMQANSAWIQMAPTLPPDAVPEEIRKELFGLAGYRDSSRFYSGKEDPRIKQMQDQLKQAADIIKQTQEQLSFGLKQEKAQRVLDNREQTLRIKESAADMEINAEIHKLDLHKNLTKLDNRVEKATMRFGNPTNASGR